MAEKSEYASLDQFSTEELQEMLRADIEASDNGDDTFTLHILEVIEQRESENPTSRLTNVDKAWVDFQKYYHTQEGIGQALYPSNTFESIATQNSSKRRPIRRMLRKVPVIAAVVAITLSIIIVAQAAGFDVCGVIAKWTDETFHFESTNIKQDVPEEAGNSSIIKKALVKCGMSPALAPTWFPEGFDLTEPQITQTDNSCIVFCSFLDEKGDQYGIRYNYYYAPQDINQKKFEKENAGMDQYSNGTQTFYILPNLNTITATWSNGQTCVSIFGKLTTKDIKKIIDSMGGNGT
jgi:hypothetical protein